MKKFVGIALVLALALSTAVMAEGTTDPVPGTEVPAVEAQVTTESEAPAEEAATAPTEDEHKALQDAMDAYRAAKQDKAVSDLEAELNEYVSAGSMTQDQADLILKNVKERVAEMKGECPNCGYDLRGQSKGGKNKCGGKMPSQQNGGHRNGRQNGQMPGQRGQMPGNNRGGNQQNGQRPDAQSGATPQQGGMQMPGNQQNVQQPQMPQAPQM